MDMFRLILPQLVELAITLFIIWLVVYLIKKNFSAEDLKDVKINKIARWITFFIVISFAIWILQIASVNTIPRSVIDRSVPQTMKDRFEERMKKDTAKQKQTDSISLNTKK